MIISVYNESIFRAGYVKGEAIVIPVNCVGVMGRGLALAAKNKYPVVHRAYKEMYAEGVLKPGKALLVEGHPGDNTPNVVIACTKDHWRNSSEYPWIERIIRGCAWAAPKDGIRIIKFPPIGCGLGGLEWEKVRPMITEVFGPLTDMTAVLYEPVEWVV